MSNPRASFEQLFDKFNEAFATIAAREGFVFNPQSGPNICKAMRMDCGLMRKGVFLEIKGHWMESDPLNPEVTLTSAAWLYPNGYNFPFYLLVKTLYSGGIDGLQDIDAKLNLAAAEVKLVDENFVRHHGKLIQGSEDCQTSGD